MRHLKRFTTVFFICASTQWGMAQTAEAVLKKATEKFKTAASLSANLQYTTYAGADSKTILETYSGWFAKKGDEFYFKLKDTEFISFKDYSVKVNHEKKEMQVVKSEKPQIPIDFESYLRFFSVRFGKNEKEFWVCELVPLKLTQQPFAKITLHIHKADYFISKQVSYYAGLIEYENNRIQPRMEIRFAKRKSSANDAALFLKKNYFKVSAAGISPAARFSKYKFYKD